MNNLDRLSIIELEEYQLKNIGGGGPIFEAIAWIYGYVQGVQERNARNMDWNDVDWDKMQVLVGG